MRGYFTSGQAAKKLGIPVTTLSTYITAGKLPKPKSLKTGEMTIYLWTEADIQQALKLLPKIKNGRKTRYQKKMEPVVRSQKSGKAETKPKKRQEKKESAVSSQKSGKAESRAKQPQPRAAVPHKLPQKKK